MKREEGSLSVDAGVTGSGTACATGFGVRFGGGVQSVAAAAKVAVSPVTSGNGTIDWYVATAPPAESTIRLPDASATCSVSRVLRCPPLIASAVTAMRSTNAAAAAGTFHLLFQCGRFPRA